MVCYAAQDNLLKPAEGNSGAILSCVTTSAGLFIGDKMKNCSNCNQKKELTEFYKNSVSKDGHQNWCKNCNNFYNKEYRHTEQRIIARKLYQQSEKGKANALKRSIRYQEQHLEQRPARNAINNAVRAGEMPHIKTLSCVNCFEQAEIYHHPSYAKSRWLKAFPVCRKCHIKIHKAG